MRGKGCGCHGLFIPPHKRVFYDHAIDPAAACADVAGCNYCDCVSIVGCESEGKVFELQQLADGCQCAEYVASFRSSGRYGEFESAAAAAQDCFLESQFWQFS